MTDPVWLGCPVCDRRFEAGTQSRCPDHDGTAPRLDIVYGFDTLREQYDTGERDDIWRYSPFLPVTGDRPVTMGEGTTTLTRAPRLGADLGVELSLKLEAENPTGCAKDRGSSALVTHARETGVERVACASTGNAAASLAAYAARGGLECSLFVPGALPDAKAIQSQVYGAEVVAVEGDYADAYRQCRARVDEEAWLDRSAGATPYAPAGARTLGYELADETDDPPEWVVVPMGNGGTIAAVWRGWQTFARLGVTPRVPRFLGVQASGVPVIHDELAGRDRREPTGTCADSIAVAEPHRNADAKEAIQRSDGTTVTVADDAIRSSIRRLGRREGIFAEPASAAVIAGVEAGFDRGILDPGDRVLGVVTGTGLKDTATAAESV